MNTIKYGNLEIPTEMYHRALLSVMADKDGHWIWMGAHSGKNMSPQMGFLINGKVKVITVAKLLFTVHNGYFPYQVRRDRAKCKDKMCVNPACHYAIVSRPKQRVPGKPRYKPLRVPGKVNLDLEQPKTGGP